MKKVIFPMLFCILLIIGCGPSNNPNKNLDYRTGTEGLVIDFTKDSPPSHVYSGSKLNLLLEVQNKGAYTLNAYDAKVYVTGFDPNSIHFSNYNDNEKYAVESVPELIGKNPYSIEGGYELLEFEEDRPIEVPLGEIYKPTIMVSSCYPYQTLATPSVCVVSDQNAIREDRVCKPGTITLTDQGGPVAVTKIDEGVMEQLLNFVITIENVGDGRVFDLEAMDKCPFKLEREDMDIVDVELEMSGSGTITCTPETNKVRLFNKKGMISCKVPVELHTSFEVPLVITLHYGYSSSATREVEIVNPPGTGGSYSGTDQDTDIDKEIPGDDQTPDINPECLCDRSIHEPCVCLHVDDKEFVCGEEKIEVTQGSHEFKVHKSDSRINTCSLQKEGETELSANSCPSSYTLDIQSDTTLFPRGYFDGYLKASQVCRVYIK